MDERTPSLTTIAIGGPHAGQSLTGSYGICQAPVREPISVSAAPQAVMTRTRTAVYRESRLDHTDEKGKTTTFRFWLYVEMPDSGEAVIRELIAGYRPVHIDCNL